MVTQIDKYKLWAELVAELNAIGPAVKDRRRWQHYWTDRVRAAKKKADEFRKNSGGTGGGAVPGEAGRIISIVGPDAVEGCGALAVPGPPAVPSPAAASSSVFVGEVPGTSGTGILGSIPTPARIDLDEHRTGVRSCITTVWCTLKTPG
ncbi:hypothetical protein HPB47_022861 [Ixodes persulcatus]|uniref:Uncharacterized protein n=1 Tax=Ixodes persulcatus TaxID=34615 RepID=A0AC60QBR9_IXOPE|nr:hypothetical protein HPB47_022861 [Ixodes persulcatus]